MSVHHSDIALSGKLQVFFGALLHVDLLRRTAAAAGMLLALSALSLVIPSVAHACYGPPSPDGGTVMYPGPPANGPCASWANDPRSPYSRQYMPPSVNVPPGYHYVLAPGGRYVLVPNQP